MGGGPYGGVEHVTSVRAAAHGGPKGTANIYPEVKSMCFICDRIEQIKSGTNPYFVRELETGYVVLGDNRPTPEELEDMKQRLGGELDKLIQ